MATEPVEWAAPTHISTGDRDFLEDHASLMWNVVSGTYLTLGQILSKVKKHFKRDPDLQGWFRRWCDECTPVSHVLAWQLITIAEAANDDPEYTSLTRTTAKAIMLEVAKLPEKYKDRVVEVLTQGHTVGRDSLREFSKHPYVEQERLNELVYGLEEKLTDLKVQLFTADGTKKPSLDMNVSRTTKLLNQALSDLNDATLKSKDLESKKVTAEMLVATLRKEIKTRDIQLNEILKDPKKESARALGKMQVELTQALDGMLSTLDRYDITRDDLSEAAARKIQDKLDLVYAKLRHTARR